MGMEGDMVSHQENRYEQVKQTFVTAGIFN